MQNGGRWIFSDTDGLGNIQQLHALCRTVAPFVGEDVGIHLHPDKKADAESVQGLVRACIEPFQDTSVQRVFVEFGLAGLGGCGMLNDTTGNLALQELRAAVNGMTGVSFEGPDMQKMRDVEQAVRDFLAERDRLIARFLPATGTIAKTPQSALL